MSGKAKLTLIVLLEDELLKVAECTRLVSREINKKTQDSNEIAVRLQALMKSCQQAFHHIIQGKGKKQIVLLSRRDLDESLDPSGASPK